MNVLIVEDEPLIARRLERLSRNILGKDAGRIDVASGHAAALARSAREDVDILLLDLNLSGDDGFHTLALFSKRHLAVIVVSANVDRALEAFDHGVVDFVAKPFSEERLALALSRARASRQQLLEPGLPVRVRGGIAFVAPKDIAFAKGADDYAELHLLDGRTLLHGENLSALERRLPATFMRVHRSCIVNLSAVESLMSKERSPELRLKGGLRAPVSRSSLAELRARLAGT